MRRILAVAGWLVMIILVGMIVWAIELIAGPLDREE